MASEVKRLSHEQTEEVINQLVSSTYPYQVADILSGIPHQDDRAVAVAAALYRSVELGRNRGREEQKEDIRQRLGL